MPAAAIHLTPGARVSPGSATESWDDTVLMDRAYPRVRLLKSAVGDVSDLRARSSKRTVRLINGVALDQCLDPAGPAAVLLTEAGALPSFALDLRTAGRTRVPFRTPEREAARAAQPRGMDYWITGLLDDCAPACWWTSSPSIHKSTTPPIHFCRAGCELVEETSQGFVQIENAE